MKPRSSNNNSSLSISSFPLSPPVCLMLWCLRQDLTDAHSLQAKGINTLSTASAFRIAAEALWWARLSLWPSLRSVVTDKLLEHHDCKSPSCGHRCHSQANHSQRGWWERGRSPAQMQAPHRKWWSIPTMSPFAGFSAIIINWILGQGKKYSKYSDRENIAYLEMKIVFPV